MNPGIFHLMIDKLLLFMGSMIKSTESTETQILGSIALKSLTTFL